MYMDETSTGILSHDNETKSKFRVCLAIYIGRKLYKQCLCQRDTWRAHPFISTHIANNKLIDATALHTATLLFMFCEYTHSHSSTAHSSESCVYFSHIPRKHVITIKYTVYILGN